MLVSLTTLSIIVVINIRSIEFDAADKLGILDDPYLYLNGVLRGHYKGLIAKEKKISKNYQLIFFSYQYSPVEQTLYYLKNINTKQYLLLRGAFLIKDCKKAPYCTEEEVLNQLVDDNVFRILINEKKLTEKDATLCLYAKLLFGEIQMLGTSQIESNSFFVKVTSFSDIELIYENFPKLDKVHSDIYFTQDTLSITSSDEFKRRLGKFENLYWHFNKGLVSIAFSDVDKDSITVDFLGFLGNELPFNFDRK